MEMDVVNRDLIHNISDFGEMVLHFFFRKKRLDFIYKM